MKLLRYVLIVLGICALCSCEDSAEEAQITIRRLQSAYPQLEIDRLTSGNGYIARDSITNRTFYFSATNGSDFHNPAAYDNTRYLLCLYDWQEVLAASPGLHRTYVYFEDLVAYLGPPSYTVNTNKEK